VNGGIYSYLGVEKEREEEERKEGESERLVHLIWSAPKVFNIRRKRN